MVAFAMQTVAAARPLATTVTRRSFRSRAALVVRANRENKAYEPTQAEKENPLAQTPLGAGVTSKPILEDGNGSGMPTGTPSGRPTGGNEQEAPIAAPNSAATKPELGQLLAFDGAPEIINGRLAMLGFVAAVASELATGRTVGQQIAFAPFSVIAAFVLFIIASLTPFVQNYKNNQASGPFTPTAELINGRLAMLGFAGLLITEFLKGSAVF
jgi:hypothetical protein